MAATFTPTMKRYVILVAGTRVYSVKLAQRMGQYFDGFNANVLRQPGTLPPAQVLVLHGYQTGADEVAQAQAALKGWAVFGIPYFGELGYEGGPKRDECLVKVAVVLRDAGAYLPYVWCFPDDRSVGTRKTIAYARERKFQVEVEELGPRRAGPLEPV